MLAFSEQSNYDSEFINKLEAICKFNALFYVEKWLLCTVGADAPFNDLQLYHSLLEYKKT